MKVFLMSAAAVLLLAGPALAQTSVTTTTQSSTETPVVVPQAPASSSYESKTLTVHGDGSRTFKKSEQTNNPDGSTQSTTVVHHDE